MVDPITEDPRPREQRELEELRELDDAALIMLLKENPFLSASAVFRGYVRGDDAPIVWDHEYDVRQYAAEYGWADTFRVLAKAIDAYEDARRRG